MQLHTIHTGNFKLDGGAMFGVVPKSLWEKRNPADSNNLCTWALRCLLIEDENRLILIDTGIGDKQDDKFFGHYHLHQSKSVEQCLNEKGFKADDITDVILTHLHFDHCGGAIFKDNNGILKPAFKNARYWSNPSHWEWAVNPNAREKASFLKDNILPIQESGQLHFFEESSFKADNQLPGIDIIYVNGHTEAMMLPVMNYKGQKIVFGADLMPSQWHIPLPWVMAYDMRPLVTLTEKDHFLNWCVENQASIFLEHDPISELCSLKKGERGIELDRTFSLAEI